VCGSKGTSTTTSTYSPPAGVQANYDYLANQAKQVSATPFQQYTGEMVAGLTPTQEAGISNVNASAGLAQPYFQAGTGYVQQAANPFNQQSLNQYMSPYINDVVAQTMANLNETNAQQQQQVLGNQIQQGAFGGDRGKIAQAELVRQQNLANGQTLANVLQGGYGQALGQFNADQARALQAGSTLGTFGTQAQSAAMQGAQAQLSAGAQQQAVQQAQDVANQQQFQAAQAYPFQTTQFLGNMLLGIGGQSGGTALTSAPGPNIGSQVLGGLTTLASIPWGSDERLKENMEPVGKTFDGQNIYKFNYKGDGHTMLGLSAQEVEKHNPNAVHRDDQGMRMVDYESATHDAADKGHFARGGVADWMGGAVQEGLGRAHFELGGMPYSDQPTGGSTKPLTLADVMRVSNAILANRPGGKTNIPQAPKPYDDTGITDVAKQLANATPEQRANMKANIASIRNNLGLGTVDAASIIAPTNYPDQTAMGGMYGRFASGGLVGRKAYAGDDGQSGGVLPSDGKTLFEKATGMNLSDNARMGLLAAGLGMLSSRSPFFGVGVGEGATAGLGTYYNALANQRAYENKQRELGLTEEEREIGRTQAAASTLNAQSTAKDVALRTLDKIKQSYSLGTGDPMYPDGHVNGPYGKHMSYDEYRKQMSGMLAASGALPPELVNILSDPSQLISPAPSVAGKALGGSATNANQSDDQSNASIVATAPAPDQGADVEKPIQLAQAATGSSATDQGGMQPIDYDKLAQDALRRRDIARSHPEFANSDAVAKAAQEDYDKYSKLSPTIQKQARDLEAQQKAMELGITQMGDVDKGLGDRSDSRPAARARINDASKLLSLWQSGRLSDIKAAAPAIAASLGLDIKNYALNDAASYETFTKDATQAMFDKVKDLGGRILVTEIEGQKQANMNPDLQPKTNRNIIGVAKGLMDAEDKFFDDYNTWRAGDGKYANLAQYNAWKAAWRKDPQNNLDNFIDQGRANTPVRGDFATNEKERKAGYKYVIPPEKLGDEQRAQYPNGLIARWTGKGWDPTSLEAPEF